MLNNLKLAPKLADAWYYLWARKSCAQQLQQLRPKSEQMKARAQSKNSESIYLKALQQKAKTIRKKVKGLS